MIYQLDMKYISKLIIDHLQIFFAFVLVVNDF